MNFYQCLALGLDNGLSPEAVQRMCLMHFARIVFNNVGGRETIEQVYDETTSKELELREAGMVHATIKAWIARVHAKQPHLHKDPRDWYRVYPRALKGLALRFLYYHRKPHRVMCIRVLAHLASELFCCRIGLLHDDDEEEPAEWIYPIDSEDYFVDMAIKSIPIQHQQQNGTFLLASFCVSCCVEEQQQATQMEEVSSLLPHQQQQQQEASFMLRRYSSEAANVHLNVKVGMFQAVTPYVHVIKYQPVPKSPLNAREHIYQVYPGDEDKTYYTLPKGCALFVFRLMSTVGDVICFAPIPLAQTASHDEYLYFQLPSADTRGVVAVCAVSVQAAVELIVSSTPYEGHNKTSP